MGEVDVVECVVRPKKRQEDALTPS
jgi:hypothetical protein